MVGEECDGIRKCWEPVSRFKFALLAWLSVAMNTSMNMDLKIIFPFSATFMDRNAIGMGFKFALPKWAPWLNEPNGIIFWRFCKKRKKKLNEKIPNICIMNIRDEYHSDRSEGQQVVIPVAVAPAVPTGVLTLLQDIHLSTEVHLFPTHPTK